MPTVDGIAKIGQTLTAINGTWTGDGITFARQWSRCDAAGASCAPVGGATGETYAPTTADVGKTLRVTVTGTNSEGTSSAASQATAVIPPAPVNTEAPAITGTTKVGETLTATTGTWTGAGIVYTRQWQRCSAGSCTAITGATGATYKLTAADAGKFVRIVITATNDDGVTSLPSAMAGPVDALADAAPNSAPSPTPTPTPTVTPTASPSAGGGGSGGAGSGGQSCSSCVSAPAPDAPKGVDATSANGAGGNVASGRFTAQSRRTIRTRYGTTRTVIGRLVDGSGTPIANAVIDVLADKQAAGSVVTDGQGYYRYKLPAGRSRTLTFAYRSTQGATTYRDTAAVIIKVGGVLRLKAKRSTIPRKGTLRLTGQLLAGPKGASLQVQARDGRRWRTIDVIKTAKKGRFLYAYTFKRVSNATFLFRIKFDAQPQTKLGPTVSKPVTIRVQ